MNPKSPAHSWLIEKGVSVESIPPVGNDQNVAKIELETLPYEVRESNINALVTQFGREAQRAKTLNLVQVALGEVA